MILAPFSRPFSMMAKPVGARCNLACTYCYYLEKANLTQGNGVMDDKLLERFIQQYIEAQTVPFVQFLAENHFLVGISIDGPREHHDAFRHTRRGTSTFDDVMRGIDLLNKHGVDWNALATVNSANVEQPCEFYEFFREIGCQFLQFTPVVERGIFEEGGMRSEEGPNCQASTAVAS